MNRQILLLFFLLATTSVINAIPHQLIKRTTDFGACPLVNSPTLGVTIAPDPVVSNQPVTFTISGNVPSDVPTNAALNVAFLDSTLNALFDFHNDFCTISGVQCPVKANTPITLTSAVTPGQLPADYYIAVGIFDVDNQTPITCNSATVGNPSFGGV
jgi:hypothetical protein